MHADSAVTGFAAGRPGSTANKPVISMKMVPEENLQLPSSSFMEANGSLPCSRRSLSQINPIASLFSQHPRNTTLRPYFPNYLFPSTLYTLAHLRHRGITHPLSDARDYLQIWRVAAGQPTGGGPPQDPVSGRRSKTTRRTKLLNSSKRLMDSPLTLRYMNTALKGHFEVQLVSNCCEECTLTTC